MTEGFVLYPMAIGDHATVDTSGEDRRRDNKNQYRTKQSHLRVDRIVNACSLDTMDSMAGRIRVLHPPKLYRKTLALIN